MKAFTALILLFLIHLFLAPGGLYAQSATADYHQRLYYTCKVWGYAKYFHQNLATDLINWDEVLISTLPKVKDAATDEEFNQTLVSMLEQAGEFQEPYGTLPEVTPSLKKNINLDWFEDPLFGPELKDLLVKTQEHFRPREHWLLEQSPNGIAIAFERDSTYHSMMGDPTEGIRLLGLFRYWNIINYFFAYKDIMDQHWDSTLCELIPAFVDAQNAIEYNLAFRILTTRINDSHALFSGPVYDELRGTSHTPFLARNIENKMVVTKVLPEIEELSPGDIILALDNREVSYLLDSGRMYTAGSNPSVIERYLHEGLMWGKEGAFSMRVDHGDRTASYTFSRKAGNDTLLKAPAPRMWWDKTLQNGDRVRVVAMGSLMPDKVDELFDFQSRYAAYIFDIREKPRGTYAAIVDKLFEKRFRHSNAMIPNLDYPGTYYWYLGETGNGNPKPYKGKVVMLFDENSRSHSEFTCMTLEQYPGALKVGCQTAGADGNVGWILAPGGIRTAFTNLGIFYPDWSPTQRVGITPDIEVRPTIQGIRDGHDEVLAAALISLGGTPVDLYHPETFRIWPNPAAELLHYSALPVQTATISILIRDVSGKVVRRYPSLSPEGSISLEGINAGIYFLEIPGHRKNNRNFSLIVK